MIARAIPSHPAVTLGNPRPVRYRISFYEPTAPQLTSSGRSFDYDGETPFQWIYATGNGLVDVTLVHSELLGTVIDNDDPAAVAWPAE